MARTHRELIWYSHFQPQTLRAAVILLYVNAGLSILFAFYAGSPLPALLILVDLFAGIGIANDKRWGFVLGLIGAVAPIILLIVDGLAIGDFLNVLFWIALLALLLHTQSRQYVRTYFR